MNLSSNSFYWYVPLVHGQLIEIGAECKSYLFSVPVSYKPFPFLRKRRLIRGIMPRIRFDHKTRCRPHLLRPNGGQMESFWLPNSSRTRLLRLKVSPRWCQDSPTWLRDDAKWGQDDPGWPQDGFKMFRGGAKMA